LSGGEVKLNIMSKKLQLFKNPLFLLLFCLGLFAVFVFVYLTSPPSKTQEPLPTITPSASLPQNGVLYIKKEPSSQSLTQEEQKFPEATPQLFPGADQVKTGTLVVVSDPPNTNIVLERVTKEEVPNYKLPYNTASFKASGVPIGEYTITAAKTGYEYTGESFKIEANKVTRVLIKLAPRQ